jgi:hypothetical protein
MSGRPIGHHGSRKRLNPIATYTWLWPGLARAWHGQWAGLAQAVGFALLVDVLLLASVMWDEILSSTAAWIGWSVVFVGWSIGAVAGRRRLGELARSVVDASSTTPDTANLPAAEQDLFPEAMNEYLQGNWLVAEEKCRELIRRRRDDVEARLLLATLLRHTDRTDDARRALDEIEKFDAAVRWEMEIACERRLLDEMEEAESEETELHETESDETGSDETGSDETADEESTTEDIERESTETSGSNLPTRRAA